MPTRHPLAFFSGVGVTLAAGGALFAVWRRALRSQRSAAATLNDLLPVHSAWWRDRFDRKGKLLYVALGDSTAQGIGASSPARSYVGRLSVRIRHATRTSVRVVNLSVSGATTWLCRKDQLPKLEKYQPDIVTVAIGANDIIDFDAETFERNLRHIYEALPSHAIVADLPTMWIPEREHRIAEANAIVRRLADEFGLTVAQAGARADVPQLGGRPVPPERPRLPRLGQRLRAGRRRPRRADRRRARRHGRRRERARRRDRGLDGPHRRACGRPRLGSRCGDAAPQLTREDVVGCRVRRRSTS
jgi:lysophospholipase L1-like esterase